ncbi:response regulator [Bradyrhizobium sp. HKCCYLS20291]|uniref:response regulator n=1 Tax=Bradyrhizobium sp. HKCCYLS20291 TaxID=3420766 RepID=UPI003EB8AD23
MSTDSKKRDVALVVDDSPETLRLLTDALDGAGMTVMVALDGAAAMRIVDQITPDIILLDAVMPGMNGFETCRKLKREAGLSNVPVIFMTGLADTEHIVQGLEAGGVDYVTKPIAVEEMLARIRVHLANARMTQSARAALDVSGRFLLAVNREGRLMWATPQAQRLLSDSFGDVEELMLPDTLRSWLDQAQKGKGGGAKTAASIPDHPELRLYYMGSAGSNEFLLRLAKEADELPKQFSSEFGLTSRESEVLSWLSKGKTNRDIAQILGLSPRTVDKHLEQIYAKLGVENRTAAAAIATGAARRGGRVEACRST